MDIIHLEPWHGVAPVARLQPLCLSSLPCHAAGVVHWDKGSNQSRTEPVACQYASAGSRNAISISVLDGNPDRDSMCFMRPSPYSLLPWLWVFRRPIARGVEASLHLASQRQEETRLQHRPDSFPELLTRPSPSFRYRSSRLLFPRHNSWLSRESVTTSTRLS